MFSKDNAIAPGEFVLFDKDGNFTVQNEIDDTKLWERYNYQPMHQLKTTVPMMEWMVAWMVAWAV